MLRRQTLLNHFLEDSAARAPNKTALVFEKRRLTYAELDRQSETLAAVLQDRGIHRGDPVVVFMDNSAETVIAIFAAIKAGAAFVVINPTAKSEKLGYILQNCRAHAMFTQVAKLPAVRTVVPQSDLKTVIVAGAPPPSPEAASGSTAWLSYEAIISSGLVRSVQSPCIDLDLASISYTSGSTGNPKGVMLSHLNMLSAADSITTYLQNTPEDVIIDVLPLSFDYGLYQVLMALKIGGTVVLEKSFAYPYQTIETMRRERVTGFPGVPTIFAILLGLKDLSKFDFSSLRYITNTAAALPTSHIRRLREIFPRARLYSMYGLTECKRVSYLPPEELEQRPTSVGKGMPNQEVYLVDEEGNRLGPGVAGELVVRGSNVMLGYWELPEETMACLKPGKYPGERILFTGDLFKMDEEGFLYFVARKDDIIKSRGEKVSPKEVENALYSLEGILEAAVIGIADEVLGESIKAFVTLETGAHLTEKQILKHCADHLEHFMVPKHIVILPALPKSANGKIDKKQLRTPPVKPSKNVTRGLIIASSRM